MRAFINTNLWVYRLTEFAGSDVEGLKKQNIVMELLARVSDRDEIVVSPQVLGEFYTTITRKGVRPLSAYAAMIETNFLSRYSMVPIDSTLVRNAIERMQRSQISYWDALIVEAALRAGATILYSEDMQHGMRFDSVEVRNPFVV